MRIFDLRELAREKQEALDKSSMEEEEKGHESGVTPSYQLRVDVQLNFRIARNKDLVQLNAEFSRILEK